MERWGLPIGLLVGAILLGTLVDVPPTGIPSLDTPIVVPVPAPAVPAALFAAHNVERTAHGLAPYVHDPNLQIAAQRHADFMAARGRFGHDGIGDGTVTERARAAGYRGVAGENIAGNFADVPTVMKTWMHSPGHRANILGGLYRHMGAAVAHSRDGSAYWCAVFGVPVE